MIEFKNLSKTYKSRNGKPCVALKGINLTLPDKGLVFIIGKSGSGKSTLLNLLGGLDTITEGDIIADGNSMASFGRRDFDNYRSSYIGFVFQHYYLLEELTVAENVAIAMNIIGEDNKDEVSRLLKKVGLEGYENRYPKELSGGQQQRVAIARALAKNPRLILGDELTGNLDHKTSVDILTTLKEISKEKLVVIVSHNLDEADMFADRIIELHDGNILCDRVRVKQDQRRFEINDGTVYLPYFRDLTPDETKALGEELKSGRVKKIVQLDDGFDDNTEKIDSDTKVELKKSKFLNRARLKFTGTYIKQGLIAKSILLVITTLMLLCVTVFTSLHPTTIEDMEYTADTPFLAMVRGGLDAVQGGLSGTLYYTVTDTEYNKAAESLGGKIYKLINVCVKPSVVTRNGGGTFDLSQLDLKKQLENFYTNSSLGTLMCDKEFIVNQYGENGELKLLAGEISDESHKLIITDFVADSYLHFNKSCKSYDDVLTTEVRIGAIIDTDYKTRYAELIERYERARENGEDLQKLYNKLSETELHKQFQSEIVYTLAITYSINPNFENAYLENFGNSSMSVQRLKFTKDGKECPSDEFETIQIYKDVSTDKPLNKGEIEMSYTAYNKIFGTGYTVQTYKDEFVPHETTLRIYSSTTENKVVIYEHSYTIVALKNGKTSMHADDYLELRNHVLHTFGLYLENNDNLDETVTQLADNDMYPKSTVTGAIAGTNKMLEIFIPLFWLVGGGLYAFIIVYLISYAISGIKKNYFRIGVMRAMGAKTSDVGIIFISGVVLMGISIVTLMLLFQNLLVDMYDSMLIESFSIVLDTYSHGLSVVKIDPATPLINASLVLSVTFISALTCIIILHRLKPIEIIRAKDNGGEVS